MPPKPDILQALRRLVAATLLLVVAAHAAAPFTQPSERASGSAFSAAASDVSLACGQPSAIIKRSLPSSPAVPVFVTSARLVAEPSVQHCRPLMAGLGPTGPPLLATTSFSPLAPRAPPAA